MPGFPEPPPLPPIEVPEPPSVELPPSPPIPPVPPVPPPGFSEIPPIASPDDIRIGPDAFPEFPDDAQPSPAPYRYQPVSRPPGNPPDAGILLLLLLFIAGFAVVFMLVAYVVGIVLCWMIAKALAAVPEEHRTIEPWQVWLLLIPCFAVVWNFVVCQRVPQSFQNYFHAQGRYDQGDCGAQLGLWYALCMVGTLIPGVSGIAGIAGLVLLVLFMVKIHQLKAIVLSGGAMYPAYRG